MVYVGTYTNGESEGIYLYRLDAGNGALSHVGTTAGVENPSYLALDPARRFLYAVNETMSFEGEPGGGITSFAVDGATGALTPINRRPTLGGAPCYVTVDRTGRNVLVANYMGGNVVVFQADAEGRLSPATDDRRHEGRGPNPERQEGPHAHMIALDPEERFALAADLGLDKIMVYRFDAERGSLTPNDPAAAELHPGAGPRHFAFHPDGRRVYVINELDSTVTVFGYDAREGALRAVQTLSTLPEGFDGHSQCADIHVHPSGRFLYGSNRGHDSIVVYAIDAATGQLTRIGHQSTGGAWPRNFAIDPTGTFLLVANQRSDTVHTLRIDGETGQLEPTGHVAEIPAPVCLKIVPAFGA